MIVEFLYFAIFMKSTSQNVQEALDRIRRGRTNIIIVQRLSTIINADSIALMHDGDVIEQGKLSSEIVSTFIFP